MRQFSRFALIAAATFFAAQCIGGDKTSALYPGPDGVSLFESAEGSVLIFPLKWIPAIEAARQDFLKTSHVSTKFECFSVRVSDNSKEIPNTISVGFNQHRDPSERVRGGGGPCGTNKEYVVGLDGRIVDSNWER